MDHNKTRRPPAKLDLGSMVYGKVPPQAKEMEEAILGAIMIEKYAIDTVTGILKPDCFYVEAHQSIYKAMLSLSNKSQPIDMLTVAEELRSMEKLEVIGGSYYLTQLTKSVVSSAHIESHSRIVLQKYIQREIIRVCGELIGTAYEDTCDPMELLEQTEKDLTAITSSLSFGDMVSIDAVLVQAIQEISKLMDREDKSEVTGIATGNSHLNKLTRGWQAGDLIIIAARPSVGKTAFALNVLRAAGEHVKKEGGCVALWSLEMTAVRLILRMLAATSGVWLMKIQTGNLSEADMRLIYSKGVQYMSSLGIWFDDNAGLTISKLKSKARRLKRKNNLKMIVIDYLQLITTEGNKSNRTRENDVSDISRSLKNLGMELGVPIIALSQLSRAVDSRSDGEPQLSDLRESGSLEQDADVVMFLYDYSDSEKAEDASLRGRRRIKVAKNRDGLLDKFDVSFDGDIQAFDEIKSETVLGGNWKPVSSLHTPSGTVTPSYYEPEKKDEDLPF